MLAAAFERDDGAYLETLAMAHFPHADPDDEQIQARAFFLEMQRQKAAEAAVAGGIGKAFGGK